MFERIIVPLDGSKTGEAALPSVKALITKLTPANRVEIILVQVLAQLFHYVIAGEVSAQIPYTQHEIEAIEREKQAYLGGVAEDLRKLGADVQIKVITGNPAVGILRTTDETKADLIAMSTHGRSGLSRWAFGSVTAKVLQSATIPVLLVREPKRNPQTQA